MDTSNKFFVCQSLVNDDRLLRFQIPPMGWLTPEEACNLAAWLVAIADPGREIFDEMLADVLN